MGDQAVRQEQSSGPTVSASTSVSMPSTSAGFQKPTKVVCKHAWGDGVAKDLDRLPSSSGEASTRKRFGSASTFAVYTLCASSVLT